jgi:hypothetical protein
MTAAVVLDGLIEQREVALDRRRHRLSISLPQRGAALNISEEEGDGAGGEIGHSHPQIALSSVPTVHTPPHYRRPRAWEGTDRPTPGAASRTGAARHHRGRRHGGYWAVSASARPDEREDATVTTAPPTTSAPKAAKRPASYRSFAGSVRRICVAAVRKARSLLPVAGSRPPRT